MPGMGTTGSVGYSGAGKTGAGAVNVLIRVAMTGVGIGAVLATLQKFFGTVDKGYIKVADKARRINSAFMMLYGATAAMGTAMLAGMGKAAMFAARIEELDIVVKAVGVSAGYTKGEIAGYIDAMVDAGISQETARQGALQFIQAQMDLKHAVDLARVAQNLAVISGMDSSEAFQRLTLAIAKANVRMLHTFGIMVTNREAWKNYAESVGKTTAELTVYEKRLAILKAVMDEQAHMADAYTTAMTTSAKKIRTIMGRYFDDLKADIGQALLPVFDALVNKLFDMMNAWRALNPAVKISIMNVTAGTAIFMSFAGVVGLITMGIRMLIPHIHTFARAAQLAGVQVGYTAKTITFLKASLFSTLGVLTLIGIALTAAIMLWIRHNQQIKENAKATEELTGEAETLKKKLAELIQKKKERGHAIEFEIMQERILTKELKETIKAIEEEVRAYIALNLAQEISRDTKIGTRDIKLEPDTEAIVQEIELIYQRNEGLISYIRIMELLSGTYSQADLQKAEYIRWMEAERKEIIRITEAKEDEIDATEQLENSIREMLTLRFSATMSHRNYLQIQLDEIKAEETLADKKEKLTEKQNKLNQATKGYLAMSPGKVAENLHDANLKLAKVNADIAVKAEQKVKTQAKEAKKQAQLNILYDKKNELLAKASQYAGKEAGIWAIKKLSDEEKILLQKEILVLIKELELAEEELVVAQEASRIATMHVTEGLIEEKTAAEEVTLGLTTIPELLEFQIESNTALTKNQVEEMKHTLELLMGTDYGIFVDASGALLPLEEILKNIGMIAALFGEEYALDLITVAAKEQLTKIETKITKLKGDIKAIETAEIPIQFKKVEAALIQKEVDKLEKEFKDVSKVVMNLDTDAITDMITNNWIPAKAILETENELDLDYSAIGDAIVQAYRLNRVLATPVYKTVVVTETTKKITAPQAYVSGYGFTYVPSGEFEQYGKIATKPTLGVFGEAGAEALIPLTRKSIYPVIREMQETLGLFQEGGIFGWENKLANKSRESHYTYSSPIVIENLIIREEADIVKVAQELERLRKLSTRAGGVR